MVELIKGNRVWTIQMCTGGFLKTYGVQGGKMQESRRMVKPKSNRTFVQQVELEMNSAINKQRDKGYHRPDEDPPRLILPMLASKYKPSKITYPCALQEKLNGCRMIAERRGDDIIFTTRKGKPVLSMDHLKPHLLGIMEDNSILDGEVFKRGWTLEKISGCFRRKKADSDCEQLQYWVYDRIENGTFRERFMGWLEPRSMWIRKVPTLTCYTESEIDLYYESIVDQGGEGIIVRGIDAVYMCDKRPHVLMKRKDFKDEEFKIIGHKRDVDSCVIWICVTADGQTFDVVPMGSKSEEGKGRLIWDEQAEEYYGLDLTVRYSELSANGIPQGNPVGICIRNYE